VGANLREHFDRAVGDDPGDDPGAMAHAAIAEGGRIRRRRQTAVAGVAAGVVTVLGAVAGVQLRSGGTEPAPPPVAAAPQMRLVAASGCSERPVEKDATDVVIFVVPYRQPSSLMSALSSDPRVGALRFEGREEAWQRFRKLWADSPDLVASLTPDSMVESFRLRLADAAQYAAFRAQYDTRDDVAAVEGRICPVSAPVGGVQ